MSINPRAFGPPSAHTSFTPGRTPRTPATGLARLSSGGGEFRSATAMQDLPTFRRPGVTRMGGPAEAPDQPTGPSDNPFSFDLDALFGEGGLEGLLFGGRDEETSSSAAPRPRPAPQMPRPEGPSQTLQDLALTDRSIKTVQRGSASLGRLSDAFLGAPAISGSDRLTQLLKGLTAPDALAPSRFSLFGSGAPDAMSAAELGVSAKDLGAGAGAGAGQTISGGAGALGALLGLLGQATKNRELATAGNLLAATSSLYSLGSGIAGAAGAGSSAAAAAAPLTAGSTASLAIGALSVPLIVRSLIDMFAPDWSGPSHYAKTRMVPEAQAKGTLLRMNDVFDQAARMGDPSSVWSALAARGGPSGQLGTHFAAPSEVAQALGLPEGNLLWGSMTPEQFTSIMAWLREDPARLSAIQGSGDIPYIEGPRAQGYADEAADYARNLIARHLGLPYKFVEPEHRLAIQSTRLGRSDGLGGAPDPQTLELMVRQERAHQQAREAWEASHPGVPLAAWTPQVLGREAELRRMWEHENVRDHGFGAG